MLLHIPCGLIEISINEVVRGEYETIFVNILHANLRK